MRLFSISRPPRLELGVLAVLAVWGIGPVLLLVIHAVANHEQFTGADGIIGGDQLQYMAWIRDSGSHVLASDLFELEQTAHVFAQPMFMLSAALWAIGMPLALAYLLWKPVAVVVLLFGLAKFSARISRGESGQRSATLILSLFFFTPLAALAGWFELGSTAQQTGLLSLAGELFPAGDLWGYAPSVVAIGLMPLALLALERALDSSTHREALRPLTLAAIAAALISWLHPWQGATLELILIGLAVWDRRRALPRLAVPFVAAAIPLAYYEGLAHFDAAWKLASHNEIAPHFSFVVLIAGLGPPLVAAAAGIRRPGGDWIERCLLLWIPASLIAYFALDSYPSHALESAGLPLAALAVRGWRQRLAVPAAAGAVIVALLTLPGMAYEARALRDVADGPSQLYYLPASESRALRWISHDAPPGGVIARTLFALEIPAQTGRRVWVGHQFWSQDYALRSKLADALFAGTLRPGTARTLVLLSGAKLVAADCSTAASLTRVLMPIVSSVHRFGCASVYVVRRPVGTG